MAWKWGNVFSNVLTKMITVDVVCYKYKPLKNGELPLKIKVCKDRKTRYINLGVSTKQEFWDFENNRSIGINPDSLAPKLLKQAVMNQIAPASESMSNVATSPIIDIRSEYKPYAVASPETDATPKENLSPKRLPFIEANTKEVSVGHLKNECIIPVFSKDNEVTISHHSFIEAVYDAANEVFRGERIDNPDVRVSHIIKGRIPEAIDKPVNLLLDSNRTIYYERMMF